MKKNIIVVQWKGIALRKSAHFQWFTPWKSDERMFQISQFWLVNKSLKYSNWTGKCSGQTYRNNTLCWKQIWACCWWSISRNRQIFNWIPMFFEMVSIIRLQIQFYSLQSIALWPNLLKILKLLCNVNTKDALFVVSTVHGWWSSSMHHHTLSALWRLKHGFMKRQIWIFVWVDTWYWNARTIGEANFGAQ